MDCLSLRPNDTEIEYAVKTYSNMLFGLCFTMLRNNADAEDAVSEVFLRYIKCRTQFSDEEHKKAWFLRVATNICKDMLRFYKIRNHINTDDAENYCYSETDKDNLYELLNLPVKYRTVLYLHYIENYKTSEIADMLSISPAAARKRLQYARNMLKLEYGKDDIL